MNFIKNAILKRINKIRNWWERHECCALDHCRGAHILIEKTPVGEWEPPRGTASTWIRSTFAKYKCENCGTIFTRDDWEYSFAEPPTTD